MKTPRIDRLPKPNEFGDFWLTRNQSGGNANESAIFPHKMKVLMKGGEEYEVRDTGTYILLDVETGFRFEPGTGDLTKYKTAQDALMAYNEKR